MSCDDPFDCDEFVCNIQLWINTLNAKSLRNALQARGQFHDLQQLEDLQRIEKMEGADAHNSRVVSILVPGGKKAYRDLCEAVLAMSPLLYAERYKQMIALLPEDMRPAATA
eukprot:scpid106963/ scgid24200/ 